MTLFIIFSGVHCYFISETLIDEKQIDHLLQNNRTRNNTIMGDYQHSE